MDLKKKVAVVTGASKGIGRVIAESMVKRGCHVSICARSSADVQRAVESLTSPSVEVFGQACDVSDPESACRLIDTTVERLGGLDILINNAGVGIFRTVEELTIENWRGVIGTNLDALFYTCHYAIPYMKKRASGFIINIGSLAGKNAFPSGAAYNASKFGLVGFSEALMQEVRHDDIQVAYIMPGSVDTWFGGRPPVGEDSWKIGAEDVAQVVVETLQRHPRCLTSRIEMRPSKPPKK
jgi:NAD(P)-dependent dehydrogenase (short-subunit alcohol dehydrogenase family)